MLPPKQHQFFKRLKNYKIFSELQHRLFSYLRKIVISNLNILVLLMTVYLCLWEVVLIRVSVLSGIPGVLQYT